MAPHIQRSLSVYRGQSRSGEGEGPGKAVLHGEQYIRVDPRLMNGELLDEIRPWMTLDSDPADHQRLDDRLEGWSLFPHGDSLFVVRLASAGIYDRRAAYFAHGRVWKRDTFAAGFDPGLHLGRSEAFDAPWRDERAPATPADLHPAVVRPGQVAAEAQTAGRYLGHLLQAIVDNYTLIITAPVADFAAGSALHALVSFARAALPANVRRECKLRIYSRFPELFLRQLGVNLLVVPDETATSAVAARPSATLLDRHGEKIAGKDLGNGALEYATAVVERTIAIPDGLPFFTERIREHAAVDARAIPIAYNLAFAFAGPPDRKGELLKRYLPRASDKLGPLRWSDLIRDDEWREFPREALLDELLTDASAASAGRIELLRAAERGAARLGLSVDERLDGWWDARDAAKVARLVELLAHDPPLVSTAAASKRTPEIPLAELPRTGSLVAVLRAEAKSGRLVQRAQESAELARAASDAAIFDLLTREAAAVDPEWARVYVRTAGREELIAASQRWLADDDFFREPWKNVPELLLDRLRVLDQPPVALAPAIASAARKLDAIADLERYLRLAEILTCIGDAEQRDEENEVIVALWKEVPRFGDSGRETLERIAFDSAWRCLRLRSVSLDALLVLASAFRKDESLGRVYEELDRRMKLDAETTTDALVRSGWWFFWRRRSALRRESSADATVLRRSALSWMGSEHWTSDRGAEATLEAWEAVMEDLPAIEGYEAAKVCGSGKAVRRWPWIPPFEEEQFDALVRRAGDLGAVAELTDAVVSDRSWNPGTPLAASVLSRSRFKDDFDAGALGWLLGDRAGADRSPLTIDESARLHAFAGHRVRQALVARGESVAALLERDPGAALRTACDPHLWSEPSFLGRVAAWMNRRTLATISYDLAKMIDDQVDGEPEPRLSAPSQALVRELAEKRLFRAASLLHVELSNSIEKQALADDMIGALISGGDEAACWRQLAVENGNSAHPIGAIPARIRTKKLSPADRERLARNGWRTFESAVRNQEWVPRMDDVLIAQMYALAASMLPAGSLGTAALQLVFSLADATRRAEVWWWQSLLKAMREWKRHGELASADDREEVALAVLFASLEEAEQNALRRALRRETDWWIPSEFGERT